MAEFKKACEECTALLKEVEELESNDTVWRTHGARSSELQALLQGLLLKAQKYHAKANEPDPEKRMYGPGMTQKVGWLAAARSTHVMRFRIRTTHHRSVDAVAAIKLDEVAG